MLFLKDGIISNKSKSLSSLYYKSATLCFLSNFGNQNKQTWIDEAPRGLNKKQYSHGFARIKHGFDKWSFEFTFLTYKFLQFQMAGHDLVFF